MIDEKKNIYQMKISVYKKRRQKYREKYNIINGKKAPEEYKKLVKNINNKIRIWEGILSRIRKREGKVEYVREKIKEFNGFDVKGSVMKREELANISKMIFYRWCIENNIRGNYASIYVGNSSKRRAWEGRMRLIRGNKKNLEMWRRFNNFMKREENE